MECSHWPTPTPTPTQTKWVCNPFASVSVSVSASVNSSAYYNWTLFLIGVCVGVGQCEHSITLFVNYTGYNEHPATTSSFLSIKIIDCNVKKCAYNEHPVITNSFFSIFLLVVSRTQCTGIFCSAMLLLHDRTMFLEGTILLIIQIYLKHNAMETSGNGLFTLPDPDSDSDLDSDSNANGYIVLCRSFHTGSDSDLDPYLDGFPNGYCTHFRDRSPSQGQISIPILLYFNQGIRVWIRTSGKFLHSKVQ